MTIGIILLTIAVLWFLWFLASAWRETRAWEQDSLPKDRDELGWAIVEAQMMETSRLRRLG